MKINRYFIYARLMPTLLTSIPAFLLYYQIFGNRLDKVFPIIPSIPEATNVTLYTSIVFLAVQLNKLIGRALFQKIFFRNEIDMPTTNLLLYSNNYFTIETKDLIRIKIKKLFGITLYDFEKELLDELNARKQICVAVSLIREILRENEMLLRHHIDYGFFKNLIGGCVIALPLSIVGIIFFQHKEEDPYNILYVFYALTVAYIIPLVMSRYIFRHFGYYYGKILFEQFLAYKKT